MPLVQWLWIVLGVLLVGLVAVVLFSYFVVRPRTARLVRGGAEVLARETHGREPILLVPARCMAISEPDREHLLGVGVLGVTDSGVIFAAAEPDRALVVARDSIEQVGTLRTMRGSSTIVQQKMPMLAIRWSTHAGQEIQAAFATADPAGIAALLNPEE